jgi:RNase P protein component
MRKWCAAAKVERNLRRLMRSTTRHIPQRTLHERDLLANARKEADHFRLVEIPSVC